VRTPDNHNLKATRRCWERLSAALLAAACGCTLPGRAPEPEPDVVAMTSPESPRVWGTVVSESQVAASVPPPQTAVPRTAAIQRLPAVQAVSHAEALAEEQTLTPALQPRTIADAMQPQGMLEEVPATPQLDLSLTSALGIAGGDNPRIAFAAARYREAFARLEGAQTLWLPSLRAGVSYNHHDGQLQASNGNVETVSRSALNAGLGVRSIGAGSPMTPGIAAEFHVSDAIFQPQVTAHAASARQAAVRSATNDTLLEVSLAYLELLRALQTLRVAEQTQEHAKQLADLTDSFAKAGEGNQADADRAKTEYARRQNDVVRAEEDVIVMSARLAQVLSVDPTVLIVPQEPTIVPIDLVALEVPQAELVATGLGSRPELAEAQHLVCEAVYRYRREKYAPLVPSVLLGISQAGFGGGTGSSIDNYDGRFDLDAAAFWELRNLGFGEAARRGETRAQYDQMRQLQVQTMDRVAREVVEAHAQVQARRRQIAVAESAVAAATQSYERNSERIREGQGLPLEVLQSVQALDEAQREYLRTLVDYNAAQFRLQRAIGWPIR
jgi:outer membrane protein TolC